MGCRYLALVNWNEEKEKPVNTRDAEKFMKKACELEDGESCWLLSTWYMGDTAKFKTIQRGEAKEMDRSRIGKLERNMQKSVEYGIKACEFDIAQSCANVARMYKIGDGVEKSLDKAKEYAEKTKNLIEIMKNKENDAGFTGH